MDDPRKREPGEARRDRRAGGPPSEAPPERQAGEDRDDAGASGPLGNPGTDEETLRHRQQERERDQRTGGRENG